MVKCESLRMNMYRITHTGKSMNFPVTILRGWLQTKGRLVGDKI